jgi:hypothetical protein
VILARDRLCVHRLEPARTVPSLSAHPGIHPAARR